LAWRTSFAVRTSPAGVGNTGAAALWLCVIGLLGVFLVGYPGYFVFDAMDEPVRLHPNLAAIYRRKVAALQNLLEDDSTRTEAVEIIRSLVDQVIFRPAAEVGLEVELVGDIAKMVHLAQSSNENSPVSGAVHDEFVRSVKVVAGVGFEPTTFRL
jgi:hypothetical protein